MVNSTIYQSNPPTMLKIVNFYKLNMLIFCCQIILMNLNIQDPRDQDDVTNNKVLIFTVLILIIMSALRMMMMMSAMMTLEICRKQRHRPHAECLLVCNCVEIVKLSSLQLFKCSVSEYQMVSALCRLHTLLSLY